MDQFDNARLLQARITRSQKASTLAKARLQRRTADTSIGEAGVLSTGNAGALTVVLDETDIGLPDLLTDLQDLTQLTRRGTVSILIGQRPAGRLQAQPAAVRRTDGRGHQVRPASHRVVHWLG